DAEQCGGVLRGRSESASRSTGSRDRARFAHHHGIVRGVHSNFSVSTNLFVLHQRDKVGAMATTDQLPPVPPAPGPLGDDDEQRERDFARKLAERYRYAFIDLREQRIDPDLIRTISADLMFRYNFVPLETHNNLLTIAAADPGLVQSSDELPLLLGKKLLIRVATARQIA